MQQWKQTPQIGELSWNLDLIAAMTLKYACSNISIHSQATAKPHRLWQWLNMNNTSFVQIVSYDSFATSFSLPPTCHIIPTIGSPFTKPRTQSNRNIFLRQSFHRKRHRPIPVTPGLSATAADVGWTSSMAHGWAKSWKKKRQWLNSAYCRGLSRCC